MRIFFFRRKNRLEATKKNKGFFFKFFRFIGWTLVIGIAIWLGINQIDSSPPQNDFTSATLYPAEISPDNGFYIFINMLQESEDDIFSQARVAQIKHIYCIDTLNSSDYDPRPFFKDYTFDYVELEHVFFDMDFDTMDGFLKWYRKNETKIQPLLLKYRYILDRWDLMLKTSKFSDFTTPHPYCNVPSLLLRKYFHVLYLCWALEHINRGDWREATDMIICDLHFCQKLMHSSRALITGLIGIVMFSQNYSCINAIINDRSTPLYLTNELFTKMRSIEIKDISMENAFIGEYLVFSESTSHYKTLESMYLDGEKDWYIGLLNRMGYSLFLQKNQTKSIRLKYTNNLISIWQANPKSLSEDDYPDLSFTDTPLWWVMNGFGKLFVEAGVPSLRETYLATVTAASQYQAVRVSAMLHLRFSIETNPEFICHSLEQPEMLDPVTGQQFVYDSIAHTLSLEPVRLASRASTEKTPRITSSLFKEVFGERPQDRGEELGILPCYFYPRTSR